MALLVNAHLLQKTFAARPLFEGLTFSIESSERIGLIGPNGAGKSTLLKILAGLASPDSGTLSLQRGLKVGYLAQVPQLQDSFTILDTILGNTASDSHSREWSEIARAHEIMAKLSLSRVAAGGVSQLDITPATRIQTLSGGWRKRVALARELVKEPDLLLLDEPTNHLDVESIIWLEELIIASRFATLTVTHDRLFLQKISNRILELDRRNPGGLLSVKGDYAQYLETKESMLAAQASQETRLRNVLRRETQWLRQGAKARTTKQQARIQRAETLQDTVDELSYRNASAQVRIAFQAADKNPKKLIEAKNISKSYGAQTVIPPLNLVLSAGSRLGLLGPNGCGKSTLIRVLLGQEAPSSGNVIRSDLLKVAYFEQNRERLNPELSLQKTICPRGDFVDFQGRKTHVKSYLDRFLFTYDQMDMAIGKLSGGEQSRVLLAMLMLQEANLLVLDEPTNDLDLATLTVLEEMLEEFSGAVLLVSHDRYFLDQISDQILAFGINEKNQKTITSFQGLSQWEHWHQEQTQLNKSHEATALGKKEVKSQPSPPPLNKKRRLGFNEQREFDTMEARIQKAEQRLGELEAKSQKPEIISHSAKLVEISQEMSALQNEIEQLYERWAELESIKADAKNN